MAYNRIAKLFERPALVARELLHPLSGCVIAVPELMLVRDRENWPKALDPPLFLCPRGKAALTGAT
jgi:hypothetical protein